MNRTITSDKAQTLVSDAIADFPHGECATCECFLGYVTQLELDAALIADELLPWPPSPRSELHTCLGCAPCPPGDHYAAYLMGASNVIQLTLTPASP